MRKSIAALFGALAVVIAAASAPAHAAEHTVAGEVTKIDVPAGKLTLRHGPITNLDMGSMTMVFRVQEPTILDMVKVGDKVLFEADRIDGKITITKIEKAQ